MLGAVVVSFFVCLLPFRALTLYIIVATQEQIASLDNDVYNSVLYFSRIMLYLNSMLNPFFYSCCSTKFRESFFKIFNIKRSIKLRTATFNTTTTSSYLTSTLNSTSDHQHQQIFYEQRKLSGKMTLSLDDLRLIEVLVNQGKTRRLTRQYSSPLFSFPLDKKSNEPTTKIEKDLKNSKISHDRIHLYVNNNELVQNLKPKSKYSTNRLLFKCNHDNYSHVSSYHKQLSFDDNLLINYNNNNNNHHHFNNNNNHHQQLNKIKLQKRYRSVRFSSTITTSPQTAKVTWHNECDEKLLLNKRKPNENPEPNTLVPLLCPNKNDNK